MCIDVQIPRNPSELFRTLYGYLIPQLFLLSFLVSFLFAPPAVTTSSSCNVKQLYLTLFDKCPREKVIEIE